VLADAVRVILLVILCAKFNQMRMNARL